MLHFRSDNAKIFSENRKIAAELFFDGMEQVLTRSFDPFAVDRSLLLGRNRPVSLKAAEVINAQVIGQGELAANPVNPPGISGLFMVIPVIKRVAPELSGFTEIIGRDSGYAGREALGIELEQLFVCPDVRAVERDKDRDIADNLNIVFMRIIAQLNPLLLENELYEAVIIDLF